MRRLLVKEARVLGTSQSLCRVVHQSKAVASCYKNAFLENTLTCNFPMQGAADHYDAITVHCKETDLIPDWDKEWIKKYGNLNFSEATNEFRSFMESLIRVPASTVKYYSYHIRNKKGFSFYKRGPNSPWANECRRVYPELKNDQN